MNNILLNSALTLDTFGEVIDMTHPLFLCKLTAALALVTTALFFFGKKLFSVSNAQDALLAIVAPSQHAYTKMPDELLVPEYGLLPSYEKIMRMIYPNAHPAEFGEKVAVATMNHQLKYGCMVWSMFNKVEEVVRDVTLITQRSLSGLPIGQTPQSVEPAVYSSEPLDVPDTQTEDTASLMPEILGVTRHLVIEPAFGLDVRICAHIGDNPLFVHFAHVPTTPLVTIEKEKNIMQELAREHTLAMLVTARLQEDYDLALANRGIEETCGIYIQPIVPHIKKSRSAVTHSVPTMYIKGEKPPVRGSPTV